MELVLRNRPTRRLFERRQSSEISPKIDRLYENRRAELDRRLKLGGPQSLSRWRSLGYLPMWALLGFFALAFIIMMTFSGTTTLESNFEAGEVLVYDPEPSVSRDLIGLGYSVIETINLKGLGLNVQRLQIPSGISVTDALSDLHRRYPALRIDTNQQILITDPS